MLFKLRQFINRSKYTQSNRLPNVRSRHFLLNKIRLNRLTQPSAQQRAAMGLLQWLLSKMKSDEFSVAHRSSCFITGRNRGISRRYNIARTKIKFYSGTGKLFGLRKSSW